MAAQNLAHALKLLATFIQTTDFDNQQIENESVRRYDISAYETVSLGSSNLKYENDVFPALDVLSMLGKNVETYSNCLDDIFKFIDPILMDRRAMEKYVEASIIKAVDPSKRFQESVFADRLSAAMKLLKEQLEATPTRWQVFLQVDGLVKKGLPISVGKVKFYPCDEAFEKKLNHMAHRVMRVSPNKKSAKERFLNDIIDQYHECWEKNVVGAVCVEAVTHEAAVSQALKEMSETLNVINFFADLSHKMGRDGCLSMPGETSSKQTLSIAFGNSSDNRLDRLNVHLGTASYVYHLKLSKENIALLKPFGFQRASQILRKPNALRTHREKRILNALIWAGRATFSQVASKYYAEKTESGREIAFLSYAVALESLVLSKGSEISYKFSTCGAHLVSNKSQRLRAKQRLNELYGVRSNIVHSGSSEITNSDLSDMRYYAKSAIVRVLTHPKFVRMSKEARESKNDKARESFDEWFEAQVLK